MIRNDFGEELRRHHSEVLGVVNRSALRTMPTILESPSDPDAEDYFTFETSVEAGRTQMSMAAPTWWRRAIRRPPSPRGAGSWPPWASAVPCCS